MSIVLFVTLIASFPLFGNGYIPTHDGEYHIIRFIEFFRMLTAGYWFPRWAPTLNSGYGIPIFLFHYPFPNYVGAFMQGVGLNAVNAFKLSLAFWYISAGFFSFFWLKKLFGIRAAALGAILGACVPYWFVDLYVRGSVGEVCAISFLFCSLMLLEYRMFIPYAFAIGGLVLSHNILSLMFVPFLLGYAFLRDRKYILGIFFGIFLSSYFWIPALFERGYVVGLNTVNFREHFVQLYELIVPSWGTELSGQIFGGSKMSFQIGIIPFIVIIGSIFVVHKDKNQSMKRLYGYVMVVLVCAMVLMFSWTSFIWERLPFLSFVQYPWRFLSMVIPVTAFAGAFVSYHLKMRFWSIVLIGVSVLFSYSYSRPVIYAPRDDHYYLSRVNFTDGTSSMGNSFSTIWTGWKSNRSPYMIAVANGRLVGDFTRYAYLKKEFTVFSDNGAYVYTPILYYPGWKALIDQKETSIDYATDGTIRFAVPGGNHQVRVVFTQTLVRACADILSIVTLVWLLGWGILGVYESRHRHSASG